MNNVTLNYIIAQIKDWADNQSILNEFMYSTHFKVDTKQQRKYPLLLAMTQPGYLRGTSEVVIFDLMFADILHGEEANLADCHSDQLEIAKDFVRYFSTMYGISAPYDIRLDTSNINFEPFQNLLDNETAGVFLRAEFILPFGMDYCKNPTK